MSPLLADAGETGLLNDD